ncbi:type II secretion system major pseudopilin GspG [Hydrogenobaculum sp.]
MKQAKRGFTLIEILIVVAIIGLIASLVMPNLFKKFEQSKVQIAKAQIETLSSAVRSYMVDTDECPKSLEDLIENKDKNPKWHGPYLSKKKIPLDPWGHPYQFRCPGKHGTFDIWSLGPDDKLDKKAIKSWE